MNTITKKQYIELTAPDEDDNKADLDRLLAELQIPFGDVRIPTEVMLRDVPVIRGAEYRVTVTVGTDAHGDNTLLRIQAGDTTARHYGLACDLGSTTIAVQLVDLTNGSVIGTRTGVNRQVSIGTDILTRIFHTREYGMEKAHRDELQALAVTSIDALIRELFETYDVREEDCPQLILAGNTTMTHFLLGLDAFCVFSTPFSPAFHRVPMLDTHSLGFRYSGRLYCFPSAANYLGGDIISGLLETRLHDGSELSLFVDIGTNGEMAIGTKEFLIAGAGAAGPALEGGISRYGMRAAPGAIDSVRIRNGRLTYTTIGNVPAKGICGSGIVDLLSELLLSGWMNTAGKLVEGTSPQIRYFPTEDNREELAVVYSEADENAEGVPLTFTQSDITQFTQTKAAAHTMVALLLEASGADPTEIQHIYLAGAFGEHIDLEAGINIGMYPDLPRERFISAGNTSLKGAYSLLMNAEGFIVIERLLEDLYYLQFAMQPNFLNYMQEAKFYPHIDMTRYPSVTKKLSERENH